MEFIWFLKIIPKQPSFIWIAKEPKDSQVIYLELILVSEFFLWSFDDEDKNFSPGPTEEMLRQVLHTCHW